jgi:hypothetical protein
MRPSTTSGNRGLPGSRLVLGILALAVGLASFAIWFQWRQTRRCLAFFGPDVAAAIQASPRVEAWRVGPHDSPGRLLARSRADLSRSRGLVHLRHGLVEDANYDWSAPPPPRPTAAWDVALAFFDAEAATPRAILAFDLDGGGMTVVGRPGSVALGRLGPGFGRWIAATLDAPPPRP